MTIALPLNKKGLSPHFSKADVFQIVQAMDIEPVQLENPANTGGCSGKKQLVSMLVENKVEKVLVRQIGERMLGRLLDAGIRVFRVPSHNFIQNRENLFSSDGLIELTDASQGGESQKHKHKKGGAHSCCGKTHLEHEPKHSSIAAHSHHHGVITAINSGGVSGSHRCCNKH